MTFSVTSSRSQPVFLVRLKEHLCSANMGMNRNIRRRIRIRMEQSIQGSLIAHLKGLGALIRDICKAFACAPNFFFVLWLRYMFDFDNKGLKWKALIPSVHFSYTNSEKLFKKIIRQLNWKKWRKPLAENLRTSFLCVLRLTVFYVKKTAKSLRSRENCAQIFGNVGTLSFKSEFFSSPKLSN